MIKAVVFDIGNVLIEWNPERYFTEKFGKTVSDDFFANVPIHKIHESIDHGGNYRDILTAAQKNYPQYTDQILCWRDDWEGLAANSLDETVSILNLLASTDITLITMTNFGSDYFKISQAQHQFLNLFDQYYVSGDVKMIKPDPRFYEYLESRSGFNANELLFTDDRLENIQAAHERGWKTHLFKNAQGWSDCLMQHGLLPTSDTQR